MKKDIKKSLERRISIISGQVRGIQEMIENEKYCVDIITQVEAVREALSSVGNLVMQNHLETHVMHQIKNGEESKAIKEMLKIYNLKSK
ncbi:MAG: hypothetical protein CEO12_580 [Parcubacteria group bacterium Gr01-1014_46]|nr:MAG: hypothetical protein CEO12_580 [Parcubacteria group bacterium Gr01-1014_46]